MLIGYSGVPQPKGIGNYIDDEGIVRLDDGTMVSAAIEEPIIGSSTGTALECDPNAAYPPGSVCWGVQQAVNANEIIKTMVPAGTAAPKPCMGKPVFKGVSNCVVAGAAALALFLMMRD